MEEFKGTKAPWKVITDKNGSVHKIFPKVIVSVDHYYIADLVYVSNSKENEANAKLIAAAPELLDALIFMRDNNDWSNDPVGKFKVEQAIKKAL